MTVDTGGRRAATALLEAAARLGPPPELERLRRRRRRRAAGRAGLAVAAVVVAGALAGRVLPGLERVTPGPADPSAAPGTTLTAPGTAGLDRHVREVIDTGHAERSEVAAGASGVWVLNRRAGQPGELVRVDPGSGQVVARIAVGDNVARPFVAPDGLVWLTRAGPRADRPELVMVNPSTNRVGVTVPLPGAVLSEGTRGLLVAWDTVWVADGRGRLLRVALPVSQAEPVVGAEDVAWLASAGGWVWATSGGSLLRIDPVDGRVAATVASPHPAAGAPSGALVSAQDSLWLGGTSPAGAVLVRLDPGTGLPQRVLELAGAERYRPKLAATDRVVAARVGADLFLVDPATDSVRAEVPVGADRGGLAAHAGAVWVTDPARGRLLRVDPGF